MPLKIMKLAITADADITTSPTVSRFFYELETAAEEDTTVTIAGDAFWDDTGADIDFLPVLEEGNSYFQVYINGVLQLQTLLAYTAGEVDEAEVIDAGQLAITVPPDSTIPAGSPIVLVVTNYTPAAEIDIIT